MSTEPNKIIYSMVGVSKFYDKKAVLKDIYLSYFYGAKFYIQPAGEADDISVAHSASCGWAGR